jgi:hypothetical protein
VVLDLPVPRVAHGAAALIGRPALLVSAARELGRAGRRVAFLTELLHRRIHAL